MGATEDDLKPFGAGGHINPVAVARTGAKMAPYIVAILVALGSGIGSSVRAYRAAVERNAAKSQEVKQKSESGYQILKNDRDELVSRILALETDDKSLHKENAELKLALRKLLPHAVRKPTPILIPAAPKPKALPNDLDQAERVVSRQAQAKIPVIEPNRDAGQ